MENNRPLKPGGRVGALLTGLVFLSLTAACGGPPTILDGAEKKHGVKENFLGSNHRVFHKILHYPHGSGLRVPGYIVGIEKADQDKVEGPEKDEKNEFVVPIEKVEEAISDKKLPDDSVSTYRRLTWQSKAHLLTHVMKYQPAGSNAVFSSRLRPCSLYSLLGEIPEYEEGKEEEYKRAVAALPNAELGNAEMARQVFPRCQDIRIPNIEKAFESSWLGLEALRDDLTKELAPKGRDSDLQTDDKKGESTYSHILLIVMGWNTPQDNAVENYNSILGHLIDQVESVRPDDCKAKTEREKSTCKFKPLVIGLSWASDWELGDLLPVPDALIRLISFPNKANDAEEVGVTWLRELLTAAVLPARNAVAQSTKLVIIGHSFGARASVAALTMPAALKRPPTIKADPSEPLAFKGGDLFIALQGAFPVELLFEEKKVTQGLHKPFRDAGLRGVLTASAYDSAVKTAFWANYAGQSAAFETLCPKANSEKMECQRIPKRTTIDQSNYGFALCDPDMTQEPASRSIRSTFSIKDWKASSKPLLYVDASAISTCNAAFTGGGSHSDIYRRETARFLWDVISAGAK